MVWLARREGKQGREANEQVVAGMTVCVLVFFNLLWMFFMWKAMDIDKIGNGLGALSTKAFMILIFALFIPLGNSMPKAQRNSAYGLRTKWSMANDRCWQQSQRFGGYTMVISGIAFFCVRFFQPIGAFIFYRWCFLSHLLLASLAATAFTAKNRIQDFDCCEPLVCQFKAVLFHPRFDVSSRFLKRSTQRPILQETSWLQVIPL